MIKFLVVLLSVLVALNTAALSIVFLQPDIPHRVSSYMRGGGEHDDDLFRPNVDDSPNDFEVLRVGTLEVKDILLRDPRGGRVAARLATFNGEPRIFFYDNPWNWRVRIGLFDDDPVIETR